MDEISVKQEGIFPLTSVENARDEMPLPADRDRARNAVKNTDRPRIGGKRIGGEGGTEVLTFRRFDKARIKDFGGINIGCDADAERFLRERTVGVDFPAK